MSYGLRLIRDGLLGRFTELSLLGFAVLKTSCAGVDLIGGLVPLHRVPACLCLVQCSNRLPKIHGQGGNDLEEVRFEQPPPSPQCRRASSLEVVYWARRVFKVPIHDTWWMTETGMILIANYPSMPIKPGSIGKPFPGIKAAILGPQGDDLPP